MIGGDDDEGDEDDEDDEHGLARFLIGRRGMRRRRLRRMILANAMREAA